CPTRRRKPRKKKAARAAWRFSVARTSASPACSTSWPGTSARWSTRWRARPGIRSTSSSSWAARRGASWTRRASGAGSARTRARTTTRRCAPPGRWTGPAGVLVDASEPLTEQDLRIVSMVIEAGRALVIAYNKWDLVDEERQHYLEREIDRQLHTARWAPRVNISAATGRHTDRLVPALEKA